MRCIMHTISPVLGVHSNIVIVHDKNNGYIVIPIRSYSSGEIDAFRTSPTTCLNSSCTAKHLRSETARQSTKKFNTIKIHSRLSFVQIYFYKLLLFFSPFLYAAGAWRTRRLLRPTSGYPRWWVVFSPLAKFHDYYYYRLFLFFFHNIILYTHRVLWNIFFYLLFFWSLGFALPSNGRVPETINNRMGHPPITQKPH